MELFSKEGSVAASSACNAYWRVNSLFTALCAYLKGSGCAAVESSDHLSAA